MTGKEGIRRRTHGKVGKKDIKPNQPIRTSSKGIWKVFAVGILALVGFLGFAYATSPISSVAINDLHDVRQLTWAQVNNTDLQRGHKLLEELHGPESVVVDNAGNWYTGLNDGRIVKITNPGRKTQSITTIISLARLSGSSDRTLSRPMGLRLVEPRLYFADAYQGIFVLDITTDNLKKLVGYDDIHPAMMFTNDLTITTDEETIYFTDTSTRHHVKEAPYSIIEGECTGRLFKFEVTNEKIEILRSGLCFPNGIQINPKETQVLVSECSRSRIVLVDLHSREIIKKIPLPGNPDNLRLSKDGGYWVAIVTLHDPSFDFLLPYPAIRDILVKTIRMEWIMKLDTGVAVKLDKHFEPVRAYYDPTGKVTRVVSQVTELDNGKILIGSILAQGIAKIDLLNV